MAEKEKRLCTAKTRLGTPCRGGALPGSDPPRCKIHSLSAQERHELAVQGGKARGAKAREAARSRQGRPFISTEDLYKVGEVIRDLLDSTLDRGEPNMLDRGLGVYLLAQVYAFRPEQKRELLRLLGQVRPNLVRDQQRSRLLSFREAQATLRTMYEQGRIRLDELPPGVLDLNI